MNLVTTGAVVIHLGLSKINCMNAPSPLMNIYSAQVVTMNVYITRKFDILK